MKALIFGAYVVGFFGLLPSALLRLGLGVDRELGLPRLGVFVTPLGGALLLAGLGLLLLAVAELWQRGKGLPISHLPPSELVVSGAFRYARHPIYVAYTLAFVGLGCVLGSVGVALVSSALLTLAWSGYAKSVEEPLLLRRYGAAYERYQMAVPRVPAPALLRRAAGACLEATWRGLRPGVTWVSRQTVLFRFGASHWVGYGGFLALGAVVGGLVGVGLLSAALPSARIAEYLFGLSSCMLIGGRVVWLGYELKALRSAPLATLQRVGFVSFGGYLGMFGFALAWQRLRAPDLGVGWLIDRTMAAALICSGFGRLGCLSYGCCYGRAWATGICYTDARAKVIRELGKAGEAPRFPAQLLSALLAFGCGALMLGLLARGVGPGFAAEMGALCYALGRFHLESFREEARFLGERLTRGQLLSMVIAVVSLGALALAPSATSQTSAFSFDWRASTEHAALALLAAVPVFVVCGYHRERVGSW